MTTPSTTTTTASTIDVRSDTVTHPTLKMREAMFNAVVGDDVYGDDLTVNELQQFTAQLLQKEAALFVPSATMANLIALIVHCNEFGSEIIVGDKSHIHRYEQGNSASLARVQSRVLANRADGTIALEDIKDAIRANDIHHPRTKLVCLENTHNLCGGVVLSKEYIDSVANICQAANIALHMDGARLFNATEALNIPPNELVQNCDTISICLSKGLAAPVGALLIGKKSFIDQARRVRKALGGGMRQVGCIAAAGKLALTEMVARLKEDHERAQWLAKQLNTLPNVEINLSTVQTNMIYIKLTDVDRFSGTYIHEQLLHRNILVAKISNALLRIVIHYMISQETVEAIYQAFKEILQPQQQ
jgi:threonine aldolase